jgi:hypothetical protein
MFLMDATPSTHEEGLGMDDLRCLEIVDVIKSLKFLATSLPRVSSRSPL